MNNDRLKFRARLGVSYYDDAGNDVDGMLVVDNVAVYHDGSVGFSEENLTDAIDRLAKTDRENESIRQYVEDNFSTESDLWYWAAGAIVEQCTGLRDKNGNLIYEGDILNAMCFEPDCEWHGCQVKVIWDKTAFQFLIFGERPYQILPFDQVMYNAENDGFELIGNIHEQAEQKDVK